MLHVIKRLSQNYPVAIKATFLGAHAFPLEYKDNHQGYIDMLIDEIIPEIKLAQYIDVFVNQVTLLPRQNKLWKRELAYSPKFMSINSILLRSSIRVKYNALSVDHLEVMTTEDIEVLKNTRTMPVALPSCSYFLSIPYTPARK
jgi:imidazolonepropionase